MNTSEAIVGALKAEGVEVLFTVPGEHTLPLLRAANREMRVLNAKLELSAAFMALAHSRLTRSVGVVLAISGPGLLGSASPVAEALVEGDALVVVATVPSFAEGSGESMHKLQRKRDQMDFMRPITKAQFLVEDPGRVPVAFAEAFRAARSGKPGPAYVEVPVPLLEADAPLSGPYLPLVPQKESPSASLIDRVCAALRDSRKPSVIAGRGVYLAGAEAELLILAERLGAPVMTTIMAKGLFPPAHPWYGGVAAGLSGDQVARSILKESDVVLAVGNRFSEMGTGRFTIEIPGRLIHVNASDADMGTRYRPFLGVRCDAKPFLRALNAKLSSSTVTSGWDASWISSRWKEELSGRVRVYRSAERGDVIEPWLVVREIQDNMDEDGIVIGDVGAHRIETFLLRTMTPGSYLTTTSYVSMGLGVPSAVAACLACPKRQVVAVVGDGAFLMTGFEISTAVQYALSPKIVVFNDSSYKILKVYEKRNYGTVSSKISELPRTDIARIAEGMGATAITVSRRTMLRKSIKKALGVERGPVVLEVMVDPEAVPLPFHDLYGARRIRDVAKRPS